MVLLSGVQALTLGVSIATLVLAIGWAIRNRSRWLYIVPPVLISIHLIVFYTALAIKHIQGLERGLFDFEVWSAAVRLHGTITVFAMVLTYVLGLVEITITFKD